MIDYARIVDDLQRELGLRCARQPDLLNLPGRSLACKIDPFYYLAPCPAFLDVAARWCRVFPDKVRLSLIKTGDLLTRGRAWCLPLELVWGRGLVRRRVDSCLLHSSFIDRAMVLYGGLPQPPPVADVRIAARHRDQLAVFLEGKTAVADLAFEQQEQALSA